MKMTDTDNGELPISGIRDGYDARACWEDILELHGWEFVRSDSRGEWWEPPGRSGKNPRGAAVTRKHGPLTVFTDSTNFEKYEPYSKFEAYAVLNYDGDEQAAARALYCEEFGVFREQDSNGNQIVRCRRLAEEGIRPERAYSYAWPADRGKLDVDDIVELPPPRSAEHRELYGSEPFLAKVTELGTYYKADKYEEVIRRVPRDDPMLTGRLLPAPLGGVMHMHNSPDTRKARSGRW